MPINNSRRSDSKKTFYEIESSPQETIRGRRTRTGASIVAMSSASSGDAQRTWWKSKPVRLHSAGVRVKSIPGVQTDNAFVNKLLGQLVTMAGVGSKYWAIALEIPDAPNGWASFTFVIDSAASGTVITPEAAAALGVSPSLLGMAVRANVITGTGAQPETGMRLVDLGRVQIGGIDVGRLQPIVMELPVKAAGLLGLDFLRRFDVEMRLHGETPNAVLHTAGAAAAGQLETSGLTPVTGEMRPPTNLLVVKVRLRKTPPPQVADMIEEIADFGIGLARSFFGLGEKKKGEAPAAQEAVMSAPVDAIVDLGSSETILNWAALATVGLKKGDKGVYESFKAVAGASGEQIRVHEVQLELLCGSPPVSRSVRLSVADLPAFKGLGHPASKPMVLLGLNVLAPANNVATRMVLATNDQTIWLQRGVDKSGANCRRRLRERAPIQRVVGGAPSAGGAPTASGTPTAVGAPTEIAPYEVTTYEVAPSEVRVGSEGSVEHWLDEWRQRIGCWWLSTPHKHSLEACTGALSLLLARRVESFLRLPRSMTAAQTAAEPGCEWVDTFELQLPEIPTLPSHLELRLPPLPRLLPQTWEGLGASKPSTLPWASGQLGSGHLGDSVHQSGVSGTLVGATGAVAGAALALVCAAAMARRARLSVSDRRSEHPPNHLVKRVSKDEPSLPTLGGVGVLIRCPISDSLPRAV